MARFRFHRGGLEESKGTEITVESLDDIRREAIGTRVIPISAQTPLACAFYANDAREEGYAETYIITAAAADGTQFVLGFADMPLKQD